MHAAEWLCSVACGRNGEIAICLSGGSTPRRLYQHLASATIARRVPWDRIHWFWGDERFVPHDDPASNYRMAYEALFSCVPISKDRVHPIPTEGLSPPEWIARQITEAFPWNEAPRYLIRDRDRIYGTVVTRRLRTMAIRDKPTAPASPWQNGYAERASTASSPL